MKALLQLCYLLGLFLGATSAAHVHAGQPASGKLSPEDVEWAKGASAENQYHARSAVPCYNRIGQIVTCYDERAASVMARGEFARDPSVRRYRSGQTWDERYLLPSPRLEPETVRPGYADPRWYDYYYEPRQHRHTERIWLTR